VELLVKDDAGETTTRPFAVPEDADGSADEDET
jgi:hypothetical protein